jgi:hypothetical protein
MANVPGQSAPHRAGGKLNLKSAVELTTRQPSNEGGMGFRIDFFLEQINKNQSHKKSQIAQNKALYCDSCAFLRLQK